MYIFSNRKRFNISIGALFIPVAIILIVYYFLGIHPFGEKAIFVVDMHNQYISYFSYLKHLLLEDGSPLYTFSKTLGGDMAGFGAYYIMSPLNLIFLFFKLEHFPTAVLLLTLSKIGLSGLTMNMFLNRDKLQNDSIIFSTAYALMAYNIVYQQNIMWLDGVILLPLVIWGIEKIIIGQSPLFYTLSLSATIIINYYIGFMICIFSVLYFVCRHFFFKKEFSISTRTKNRFKPVLHFGAFSLLAAGLSAFIVLPVLYSLQGGKADFSFSNFSFQPNFNIFDLFSKLFVSGSYEFDQMTSGLPNIYCGIFVVLFCILFFTDRKTQVREKIGYAILLSALICSFYINAFNLVWHGFNGPTWFPFRYSFVFSFLLIVLAYKGYDNSKQNLSLKNFYLISITILIITMLIENFQYQFLDIKKICFTIVLMALAFTFFALCSKIKFKVFYIIVACVCFIDLGVNAFWTLNWLSYDDKNDFVNFVRTNEPVINQIKEDDGSFYRVEKTYRYNHNDAMMFDYRGLTHFSSSEKGFVKDFMGKMGYRDFGIWASYCQGSTISADSLLGVKYLLTKGDTITLYDLLERQDDVSVYRNPYALPLGFMVDEDVLNVSIHQDNLFEIQNDIWGSMVKQPQSSLFFPAQIKDIVTKNLLEEEYENGIHYFKEDEGEDAFIEFYVQAMSGDPLYAYFPTEQRRQVEIFLDEEPLGTYFEIYRNDIVGLGKHEAGGQIVFRMELNADDVFIDAPLFYHQDMNVFTRYYNELSASPYRIHRFTDSYFEGEILNPGNKNFALFTIPYEEDWEILVDGNPVSAVRVFDTLIAVEIPEGKHSIVLNYIPGNMYLGLVITGSSCVVLIFWGLIRRLAGSGRRIGY